MNSTNLLDFVTRFKVVSILFVLFLFFTFWLRPSYCVDPARHYFDEGAEEPTFISYRPIDSHRCYGIDDLQYISKLSKVEMKCHKRLTGVIDTIYIPIYTILSIALLTLFLANILPDKYRLISASFLPLFLLTIDFIENFYVIKVLKQLPELDNRFIEFCSLYTYSKWLLTDLLISVLIVFGTVWLTKKVRKKLK